MTKVNSSQIDSIGYDADKKVMTVMFRNGGTYEYSGVPAAVHASVMGSSSVGSAFTSQVKNGGYSFRKV